MTTTTLRSTHRDRFRELIHALTGISLPPTKVQLIDQRLRRRVVAFDLPDTETYLELLLDGALPEGELRIVIDLITTNTTSFFREADHFTYLANVIAPKVAASGRAGLPARLKLWSAAASEGAEAYSAAMVLEDARLKGLNLDFAILGTDLSQRIVAKAKAAIYEDEQLTTVPQDFRRRYFLSSSDPELAGRARIVPELRKRVKFAVLNLMDNSYPVDQDIDVIFLRNILIYFDIATKGRVVARLSEYLRPGGILVVGHAESMAVRNASLQQIKPTIFQKG
jgi:chemotaxis protein methyltransferase CheR